MGLWIYELAGRLPNGESILLHCSLMNTNKKFKEKTPVHTVVEKWVRVIKEKGHPNTLLVFDSYYFSSESRQYLLQNGVKVCAAVSKSKYPQVVTILSKHIHQAGDIEAAYNEKFGEIVLGYYNPDPQVKRNRNHLCVLNLVFIFTDWSKICLEQCLQEVEEACQKRKSILNSCI